MLRALVAVLLLAACADTKDEPDRAPQMPKEAPWPTSAAPAQPQKENVVPKPDPPPPPPPPPPPVEAVDAAPPGESEPIEVILEGGTIKVGRRRVTEAQLVEMFEKAATKDPRTQVIIKVLGTVSRARKSKIISDAEGAGLSRVGTFELGGSTRRKKKRKR